MRSQDTTAVASCRRGKAKGRIAYYAPRAAEEVAASPLAGHPRRRYGGSTVKVGGGGICEEGRLYPRPRSFSPTKATCVERSAGHHMVPAQAEHPLKGSEYGRRGGM